MEISRRDLLKGVGAGAVAGVGWVVTHPLEAVGALEATKVPLDAVAEYLNDRAINRVKKELPGYPVEILGRNPHYVPLIQQFQMAVAKLEERGTKSFWNYPDDFVTLDQIKKNFPKDLDLGGLINNPGGMIAWSGRDNLINDPDIPDSFKKLLRHSDSGIHSFIEAAIPDSSFGDKAVEVVGKGDMGGYYSLYFGGQETKKREKLSTIVKDYEEEVRGHIEQQSEIRNSPVGISELIEYFGRKNGGDLIKAVADVYVFLRLVSRNSFETGIANGDSEESRSVNINWLKKNISDPIRFVDSNAMPYRETLHNWERLPWDMRNDLNPVNQFGTLYHLFNTLFICSRADYRSVINMAILRTYPDGDLKLAREVAAVSEIPETLDYLDRLKR